MSKHQSSQMDLFSTGTSAPTASPAPSGAAAPAPRVIWYSVHRQADGSLTIWDGKQRLKQRWYPRHTGRAIV